MVVVAEVPWARHGAGHTRAVDDQVAWLVTPTSKTAMVELMRIAWRTVSAIAGRVVVDARAVRDPFASSGREGWVLYWPISSLRRRLPLAWLARTTVEVSLKIRAECAALGGRRSRCGGPSTRNALTMNDSAGVHLELGKLEFKDPLADGLPHRG